MFIKIGASSLLRGFHKVGACVRSDWARAAGARRRREALTRGGAAAGATLRSVSLRGVSSESCHFVVYQTKSAVIPRSALTLGPKLRGQVARER